MKKNILNTIFITLITVAFLGCKNKDEETNKKTTSNNENQITLNDAQIKNLNIQLGSLVQQNMSSYIQVNGKIDVPPQNLVSVSMPLGGFLKHTKLLPGMHFEKGDVIAIMEDQQYIQLQQDYLLAKSKIDFLYNDLIRQKELNKTKVSSDKTLQQAEADYNAQKILVNALAQKLQLIHINPNNLTTNNISKTIQVFAPIDGFVTKVNVNIGKYVAPTDVMFELVNPTDIHLNLNVFEKDIQQVFIGQKVKCFTNHQPSKQFNGEVILIGKDVNSNRSTEVHCHFDNYDKTLLPGTYMNAFLQLENKKVLAIEQHALIELDGKKYLFTQSNNNSFNLQGVEVGIINEKFAEIKNNNDFINKKIVTQGAYALLMAIKNTEEE